MDSHLQKVFKEINDTNSWGDEESLSGTGSNLQQTSVIRKEIPQIINNFNIQYMLDAPCGDFFWMKEIKDQLSLLLTSYTGLDIVEKLVLANNEKYGDEKIKFELGDITKNLTRKYDLIFTRDCLVHLSYQNIFKVIHNFKKSKSKYLLTTTFSNRETNTNIKDGEWRPLNLQKAPFNFPEPILLINENCTENNGIYSDKCLGLWKIESLKTANILDFLKYKYLK